MDEQEFNRLLDLFPVVRSKEYCFEQDSSRGLISQSAKNEEFEWKDAWNHMDDIDNDEGKRTIGEDMFWKKLRLTAEKEVGPMEAEHFCKAFKRAHEKLIYEELSLEAAKKFISS